MTAARQLTSDDHLALAPPSHLSSEPATPDEPARSKNARRGTAPCMVDIVALGDLLLPKLVRCRPRPGRSLPPAHTS